MMILIICISGSFAEQVRYAQLSRPFPDWMGGCGPATRD